MFDLPYRETFEFSINRLDINDGSLCWPAMIDGLWQREWFQLFVWEGNHRQFLEKARIKSKFDIWLLDKRVVLKD